MPTEKVMPISIEIAPDFNTGIYPHEPIEEKNDSPHDVPEE